MFSDAIQPYGDGMPMQPVGGPPKVPLPRPEAQEGDSPQLSKCGRFWAIPASFFGDRQWMLFLCLFFGVATQAFTMVGGKAAAYVPYFGIVSSPLYLVHAMRSTVNNFKMVHEAQKTKRFSDGFFYAILTLSSFGTAFGDISKPFTCGVQLAGLSNKGIFALICGRILPIVMIATGSISGVAAAIDMWRTQINFDKLKKKLDEKDQKQLAEILNPIRTKQVAKLDERKRKDLYFGNNAKRNRKLETKLQAHQFTYSCPIQDIKIEKITYNQHDLLHRVNELLQKIVGDEVDFVLFREIYSEVEAKMDANPDVFKGDEIEAFRKKLKAQMKMIEGLEQKNYEPFEDVRAEMHRQIATSAIFLFMAVLSLTGGLITTMKMPYHQMVGSIMIITGCVTGLGNILFDKYVDHEDYLWIDKWLHGRLKKRA